LPLFWSNGGRIFEGDKLVLDSASNTETLKFLRKLVVTHKIVPQDAISYKWNRAMQLFSSGRAVIAFGGSYEKRMIQEVSGWNSEQFYRKVGFTPIPAGPKGKASTTAGGMSYVVYEKSPRKKLAFEIVKLAVSPGIMQKFLIDTYQHPPRKSIAKSLNEKEHPFLAQTTKYLYKAETRPTFPQYSALSDHIQSMIETVVRGKEEPETALKTATSRIKKLMNTE
jgi:multiple sugar transport system substrate-binding protein